MTSKAGREKCSACCRLASQLDGVKCIECQCLFHRLCVNIPMEAKIAKQWLCSGCKAKTSRIDNSNNVVGVAADVPSLLPPATEDSTSIAILNEVRLMSKELLSFREDFNEMREALLSMKLKVESVEGRVDRIDQKLVQLEKRCSEVQGGSEVSQLLATVDRLQGELHERDQDALRNDIEVTGIPEEKGESAEHLIALVAEKLCVQCSPLDVVSVERAGLRRVSAGGEPTAVPAERRPRPLVVRLVRRQMRDAFLSAARVRRGLTTEGLGLNAPPTRFYVNERLSKYNKMLFFKVREEARSHGWNYAWTHGGRIFVRRETGKAALRVRSELDLQKVFGAGAIGSPPNRN